MYQLSPSCPPTLKPLLLSMGWPVLDVSCQWNDISVYFSLTRHDALKSSPVFSKFTKKILQYVYVHMHLFFVLDGGVYPLMW